MSGSWKTMIVFLGVMLLALPGCKEEAAECGNGVMEGAEVCDGTDFDTDNCQKHGFRSGYLTCNACQTITTELCVGGCGNGTKDPDEECDQSNFGGSNCQVNGFDYGHLICTAGCTIDLSGCVNAVCGNGEVEEVEECDFDGTGAPMLGDEDCEDHGFNAGTLACYPATAETPCHFDISGCERWECGNGVVDPGEDCDFDTTSGDPILEDETCVTLGYDYGDLTCVPKDATDVGRRCKFDVSQCMKYVCGNGEVEGDEECEVGVTITATCVEQGFQSGTLTCKPDSSCEFDKTACVGGCGNDLKEGTEECDGPDVGTDDCSSITGGAYTGDLRCKVDCTYDLSQCVEA